MCNLTCEFIFVLQKTESGLFVPDKSQVKINKAKVLAVGAGKKEEVQVLN